MIRHLVLMEHDLWHTAREQALRQGHPGVEAFVDVVLRAVLLTAPGGEAASDRKRDDLHRRRGGQQPA